MTKIKCNNIDYRKGYIEVIPNIHDGFINIETWGIHADIDLSKLDIGDPNFPENGVVGNTEVELNIDEAERLIELLQHALKSVSESQPK